MPNPPWRRVHATFRRPKTLVLGLTLALAVAGAAGPALAHSADGSGRHQASTPGVSGEQAAGTKRDGQRQKKSCKLTVQLRPTCGGALSGAFILPRPGETYVDAVRRYEAETQSTTQVLHFYYRGDRAFPNAPEQAALGLDGKHRTLFAAWKPDDGYTWRQVANGAADDRILAQARYLKTNYDHKMFLTVHHEPEDEVIDRPGSGFEASDYRAMYRHVVDIFREVGADKVVFVMNFMGFQNWALTDWFEDLYPGSRYVQWIAFDSYKTARIGGQEGGFPTLVNQYYGRTSWRGGYQWAREKHPWKPVMLAEWGIGERAGDPDWKADFFRQVPSGMKAYPKLEALIYFDNDEAQSAGNVSVDTSAVSLDAFRDYLDSGAVAKIG